jgi:hypothetical protein
MCSLCAALGGSRYWTDAAGHADFEKGGRKISLGDERSRRVGLLNLVLETYGLSISDWGGNSYVLENRQGRSENMYNLAGIWAAADRLAERPCDPLDPALVERLAILPQRAGKA